MKISDILRIMADIADTKQSGEGSAFTGRLEPVELQSATVSAVVKKPGDNKTPSGNDKDPDELFLPPLQQKQELLKKAVGVENIYDDGTPEQQEIEREAKEGPWTGPEKEYDYVGAPQTEEDIPDGDHKEGDEKIANESQDEITRLKKNAGMKIDPVVLSNLADDEPLEG